MIERGRFRLGETLDSVERVAKKIMYFSQKGAELDMFLEISRQLNAGEEETRFMQLLTGYRLQRNEKLRLLPGIEEDLKDVEGSISKRRSGNLLNKFFFKPIKEIKQTEKTELEAIDAIYRERVEDAKLELGEKIGHERADLIQSAVHDVLTLYFVNQDRSPHSLTERGQMYNDLDDKLNYWRARLDQSKANK